MSRWVDWLLCSTSIHKEHVCLSSCRQVCLSLEIHHAEIIFQNPHSLNDDGLGFLFRLVAFPIPYILFTVSHPRKDWLDKISWHTLWPNYYLVFSVKKKKTGVFFWYVLSLQVWNIGYIMKRWILTNQNNHLQPLLFQYASAYSISLVVCILLIRKDETAHLCSVY